MAIEHYREEIQWRGPIFRQCKGIGLLIPSPLPANVSASIQCEFEVFLFQNGDIYAYGEATDDETHTNPQNLMRLWDNVTSSSLELKGQAEGADVRLKSILMSGVNVSCGGDEPTTASFRLCVGQFEEAKPYTSEGLCELRFYLTNLELPPLPPIDASLPEGKQRHGNILELKIGERTILLEPTQGEKSRFERLKVTQGCEITATASVFCTPNEQESIKEQIVLLCSLLTFVQGTRVNWLAYELLSIEEEPTLHASWWHNAVTRRFGGATLLNRLVARDRKMLVPYPIFAHWFESIFPRFVEADSKWNYSGLINAYLDAADGSDFLELRGLKICGCMEILRDRYLEMENKVHQIDPAAWNDAVPVLKARTLPVLKELLPNESEEILSRLTNHFEGMNYYAFRRALTELCRQVGYGVNGSNKKTKEAIGAFLSIRNGLVHRGHFAVPVQPSSEWTKDDISSVRWAQYQFIERFCGGLLAAIIGWNEAQSLEQTKAYMPFAPRVWEGN